MYSLLVGSSLMFFSVSWFFYLLVLVFLGGVIVLIIYIRTLSANEKFIPHVNPSTLTLITVFIIRPFFIFSTGKRVKSSKPQIVLTHLYEYVNYKITLILIIYLFITIVCVVKLVKFEKGPLIQRV